MHNPTAQDQILDNSMDANKIKTKNNKKRLTI